MDPNVKRKIRLVVALSAAVLLAVALIYTSFSASSQAKEPSDLVHASPGQSYEMTGVVVPGSIHHHGSVLNFRVEDRDNSKVSIPVKYRGEIPDPFTDGREIVVTGSGRLDLYRFGGDSLQGRYHLLHLHPFSVAEQRIRDRDGFDQLLRLGGFPEPFLGGNEVQARRWSREDRTRLIREDVDRVLRRGADVLALRSVELDAIETLTLDLEGASERSVGLPGER